MLRICDISRFARVIDAGTVILASLESRISNTSRIIISFLLRLIITCHPSRIHIRREVQGISSDAWSTLLRRKKTVFLSFSLSLSHFIFLFYRFSIGKPQPDNREAIQGGAPENCLAILNQFYNDGVNWHDVACHHKKPWVCEENESLLRYVRFTNPNIRV